MRELAKGIAGILGILAFCAMMYLALAGGCIAIHGIESCFMEVSDE